MDHGHSHQHGHGHDHEEHEGHSHGHNHGDHECGDDHDHSHSHGHSHAHDDHDDHDDHDHDDYDDDHDDHHGHSHDHGHSHGHSHGHGPCTGHGHGPHEDEVIDEEEMLAAFDKAVPIFLNRLNAPQSEETQRGMAVFMSVYQFLGPREDLGHLKTKAAICVAKHLTALPAGTDIGNSALVLGAFCEYGADCDQVAPHYLEFLKKFAAHFAELVRLDAETQKEKAKDEDKEEGKGEEDKEEEEEEEEEEETEISKLEDMAQYIGAASAAVYSNSKEGLLAAQKDADFIRDVTSLRWRARFLHHIMVSPVDMEVYVFVLPHKFGCKAKITGISDNVQLNALMEDAFAADHRGNSRPLQPIERAIYNGTGPQQARGGTFSPQFQLSNWTILLPDSTVEAGLAGAKHWIWGEGVPADIFPCPAVGIDGKPVILVYETAVARSNNLMREFGGLQASFTVLEYIEGDQLKQMLGNIADIDENVRTSALMDDHKRTFVNNSLLK